MCNCCSKPGLKEKDYRRKHPEKLSAQHAKSGVAISVKLLDTFGTDYNLQNKAKHVFGLKNKTQDRHLESANSNVLHLQSFKDNNNDLNDDYSVKPDYKEIDECLEDTQIKKDNMFSALCYVTKDGYNSDKQNSEGIFHYQNDQGIE